MEEILILVESYGLPLVLLLGALYAYIDFLFLVYMKLKMNLEKDTKIMQRQCQI